MPTRRAVMSGGGAGLCLWLAGCGEGVDMPDYAATARAIRAPLSPDAGLAECIRYATLAANGHNTQPWRFAIERGGVRIRPDFSRRTPAVDPDDHHLWVSLGCAAENFRIAARARGLRGEFRITDGPDGDLFAQLERGAPETDELFEAIPRRQCTRSDYQPRDVPSAQLAELEKTCRVDGVRLILITDPGRRDAVTEQVVAGNTAQMADPAFVAELKQWIRFNEREALHTRDGLFSASSGNPTLPGWLASLLFPLVFTTGSENDRYARQMRSSAGLAVFVSARDDPAHWVSAGRAVQRFALKATALGIAHAFVNQPVEVPALRAEFATWLGLAPGERPDLVVRFGYAPPLPMSLRRSVEEVLA